MYIIYIKITKYLFWVVKIGMIGMVVTLFSGFFLSPCALKLLK